MSDFISFEREREKKKAKQKAYFFSYKISWGKITFDELCVVIATCYIKIKWQVFISLFFSRLVPQLLLIILLWNQIFIRLVVGIPCLVRVQALGKGNQIKRNRPPLSSAWWLSNLLLFFYLLSRFICWACLEILISCAMLCIYAACM